MNCQIVEWISDEPQPGLVEAQLTDARGKVWVFVEKQTSFSAAAVRPTTAFPVSGEMRCDVISRRMEAGREIVTIRTVDADSGGHDHFDVDATSVHAWKGRTGADATS